MPRRRNGVAVSAVAFAAVVLFAAAVLAASVLRHPQYTPDGIVYARFAARDAGYTEREATLRARAFYEHTPMIAMPRYRALIELAPAVSFARSHVFDNRVLYPWLVSRLLPVTGFRALFIVSGIAYVAFGAALFWFLTAFGKPWLAAVLCVLALALPITRQLAASDLTDMLSAVWWTLGLGALARSMQGRNVSVLITLALASILLTLTRPTPYLLVVPALALSAAARTWWPLAAACSAVPTFIIVAALTHSYGAGEQLRWVYAHEPHAAGMSFAAWYRAALSSSLRYTIVGAVRTVAPVVLVALAVYGIVRARMRDEMFVLLAAIAACLIAVPFNPVPSAIPRVVLFPMIPVFCAIVQCFVGFLVAGNVREAARAPNPATP